VLSQLTCLQGIPFLLQLRGTQQETIYSITFSGAYMELQLPSCLLLPVSVAEFMEQLNARAFQGLVLATA
jgi:hypothetical protein